MIAESSWSEGDDVIIERTFTVLDEGHAITLKRRYMEITEEKMQLIWRSAETIKADARFCAYSQRLPLNDDDTLIIYKNNGYTSLCHGHPTIEKPDENHDSEADLIQPQDVVVGDQYIGSRMAARRFLRARVAPHMQPAIMVSGELGR